MEEKMFVCFKLFDLGDDDVISAEDLTICLTRFLADFGINLTAAQISQTVRETLKEAGCSRNITFSKFKVLFIRSRGLIENFTLETWSLIDETPETFPNMISEFVKFRRSVSDDNITKLHPQPLHKAPSDPDMVVNTIVRAATSAAPYPRDPNLKKWYDRTVKNETPIEGTKFDPPPSPTPTPPAAPAIPAEVTPSTPTTERKHALAVQQRKSLTAGKALGKIIGWGQQAQEKPTVPQTIQTQYPPLTQPPTTPLGPRAGSGSVSSAHGHSPAKQSPRNAQGVPQLGGKKMANELLASVMGKVLGQQSAGGGSSAPSSSGSTPRQPHTPTPSNEPQNPS
eukprot:c5785_g1_i1.p1 GENE.c5785_g1_i1~~c5785_g1_i1.p1  ORF type:complete len:339 (+),score=73.38 c5785_g1_i1:356-1372(+)